ncbi:hypothetical protein DH2020_020382 [Rehmannia glutinosa]|uniref:AB hydrolase-1 domain-containing protein n=1 Tax=Rehmannia glutinosa TaxID=99300 RepID=A0ABR0WFY7_REHGL
MKVADFFIEAEWKACYCSSAKEAIPCSGKIFVSEPGESKIVRLTCSKLQLEEISDTLYTRPSLVSEVSKSTIKRSSSSKKINGRGGKGRSSTFTVNSTIIEMLQGKIGGQQKLPIPRWSDCDCKTCTSWTSSSKETLFVKVDGARDNAREDVVFIHGFISSSAFWTETLYPNFSKSAKSKYRFHAVDLLGFGRSPKPTDSLYTLREHLDMIEKSVLEPHKVKSFHIVAHSLGCILALALAVKHPGSVKSLTLLAPVTIFSSSKGGTSHTIHDEKGGPTARVASDRIWRVDRLLVRTHQPDHLPCDMQEPPPLGISRQTTHQKQVCNSPTLIHHSPGKIEGYLDEVKNRLKCDITIYHGRDDELIPVECSYNVQSRIPRAHVKVLENKDHITIVVGRQEAFARELEGIWKNASP